VAVLGSFFLSCSTAAFPRQLVDISTPLAGTLKTNVEQFAAGQGDF
jgi:hypothetical protein